MKAQKIEEEYKNQKKFLSKEEIQKIKENTYSSKTPPDPINPKNEQTFQKIMSYSDSFFEAKQEKIKEQVAPPPEEKSDILVPLLKDIQTKSELIEKLSQKFSNLTFEEARPIINELVYLKSFPIPQITERGEEIFLELFMKVS